jgi:4-carboxymuconolactone decarboxylase
MAQVKQNDKKYNMTSIKDKGQPAPKEYFTGNVWVNMAVNPDDHLNSTIGKVTFEAKARTNWHTHPYGQILIVTEGTGYYQEKGKPIQVINKDDVIKIPVNVEHWHGASHESAMTHIAIVPSAVNGTIWMTPVSDTDYDKTPHSQNAIKPVKLTAAAIKNHEQLWPDYASQAQATDPELIEVFDNFAFDDVIRHDDMDAKTRTLMIMASTIGSQALTEYKMFVNAALNVGVTPVEIKEVLYQAVPYVGIAKVIDFIYATNEIFKERGTALPLESQSTTTRETRKEIGLAKQKEIVGNRIDEMYTNSPKDLLHIQEYLSANCFGDFVTRNGLDVKKREMVTLSFLIALGGTESQIKGHIQGNANVGNGRQNLINLVTQLIPYVGYPRALNAITCLNEILPEKKN